MLRWLLPFGLCLSLSAPVLAGPAVPFHRPEVARLEWGIFCALSAMDQAAAPGTLSGYMHVARDEITLHWPEEQVVPARPGIAFGVRARASGQIFRPFAEVRLFRPGSAQPETWNTTLSADSDSLIFFRFDTEDELLPGLWRFELHDAGSMLYSVEFEVVPAEARRDLADACGATS